MSIVAFCSATGSPGVTTTALGLALAWPRDVLLADCDRDPAQTIEAGYLRGLPLGGRGLGAVARAHRERRPLLDEVLAQAVPLTDTETPVRRFLPGFGHPGAANVFGPVWPDLAATFAQFSASGTDVLVDAGRPGRDGLPVPLVLQADLVLMVVRSSLRSLASARLHLPALVQQVSAGGTRAEVGLCVVGPDMPYSAREIGDQFGVPVRMSLAHNPGHAAVLTDGADAPRRHDDASFSRSLRTAAQSLHAELQHRDAVIDAGSARDWDLADHTGGAA